MQGLPISAMTASCAAGNGLPAIRSALQRERSGLRPNSFPRCDLDTWIGMVDDVVTVRLPDGFERYDCRNNRLAMLGLEQDGFIEQVTALRRRYGASRVACVMGTSTAGIEQTEQAYRAMGDGDGLATGEGGDYVHNPHTSTRFVAEVLGLSGPTLTISTACSSSAKVFLSAARLIAAGLADSAVVGGVDSLCLSVLHGFHSLELVSNQPCRPFDRTRNGLNLGEGAGFAILDPDPGQCIGRLLGGGERSDAWHMASPHPEGAGAIAAMTEALASAGYDPEQVDYINCHGTATPMNDRIEAAAIRQVFALPPPASSTKGWTGHALGAAGILESVISLLAISDAFMPASFNCAEPEADWEDFVLIQARRQPVQAVLSNSFGFGGSNCSLLFGAS
jgi:3-oxoacyl-[acyl-carrier-protein] synthase I